MKWIHFIVSLLSLIKSLQKSTKLMQVQNFALNDIEFAQKVEQ